MSQADKALIPVTYENYNQAETARNFNNWAKLGGNNTMRHLKELSPIGNKAPTIRMNLDTLYSVGVYDNDGELTKTIPESGLYQSIMILDTDGYTPFFTAKLLGLKLNKDGSATVYFGPKAPAGHEGNWIQTIPNKGYNVLLRLYGPLQPWFDRTWKPGDFELLD